jgi:crotonobetainyl-CoA:carnitine CoA-transferase CaiB-like acyl-CoA transferase
VDISLYEALLAAQSPIDVLDEFSTRHGVEFASRQRVSPGWVACQDGVVCVSVFTAQNWRDLCSLIEHDEWTERMVDVQNNGHTRDEFLEDLAAWTLPRSTADVITTLQVLRIAAAVASDGRTLLEQPPFVDRGFYVPQPGATFLRPAAPYRLSETPVTIRTPAPALEDAGGSLASQIDADDAGHLRAGGDDDLPLAGLRVVDLTSMLAGGHLSRSLAALGAEVIKVESSRRPDGYRFVRTYPELGDHWWEISPLWQGQALGKKSLSLDLTTEAGQTVLAELVATADVVAENYTPRVVEQFGFDYERVRALNPRAVMVRMPAFGLEGPWRDHAGFAWNIEQVAGLAQNGVEGGPLVQPAGVVDVVNGQHALVATLAALRHRDRTGCGQLIEVSQVETVACLTADQVIEYQLTGSCRERIGNRSRDCAPQGIYATADDRWIAITATTDEQWLRLCAELAAPSWAASLDLDERVGRHDELDELLARWAKGETAGRAVSRLQARGVPAGVLATLPEIRENPQVVERGYYPLIEHPHAGIQRCARPVPLFSFGDLAIGPAPTLGQHNDEVLRAIGLDDEAIDDLRRRGVVAEGLAS